MKMKLLFLVISAFILITCSRSQDIHKYDMVYRKPGEGYFVNNLSTSNEKSLEIHGENVSISPDGLKIAYTKYEPSNKESGRSIYIADLNTLAEKKIKSTNTNIYGPVWSPDNVHLAFCIYIINRWQIGIYNTTNDELKIISGAKNFDIPTWSLNGEFLFATDSYTLYRYNPSGQLLSVQNIREIVKSNLLDHGPIYYSLDYQKIFWIGITDHLREVEGIKVPTVAIYMKEINIDSIFQLTPLDMDIETFFIDRNNNLYFSGYYITRIDTISIYRIRISENRMERIIKNAYNPSFRQSSIQEK